MKLEKMEPGWKKIFTTNNNFSAELLVSVLKDEGVDAVNLNHHDSVYPNLGVCEVYVNQVNENKALELLKNFEENE